MSSEAEKCQDVERQRTARNEGCLVEAENARYEG